ncbi:MAG: PAS domain S-box protein [Gammaproteobacteria bacterium]|nr:PAS domain S-box protein [Gammaproteobacteria bacterium]
MSASPTIAAHKNCPADHIADEHLLRAIAEQSRDVISILSAQGTIRYANRHVERVLGYSLDSLLGKPAFDLVHPEDQGRIRERLTLLIGDASRSGQFQAEYRLRHRDGSWRWFEAVAVNLLQDPAVAGILVNARDITERKQAQLQLARAEEALRHSELRYRSVVEFTPGFVQECEVRPNGEPVAIWVSEGFQALMGVSLAEFAARGGWRAFVRAEDHASVLRRHARIASGEHAEGELHIVDAHGKEHWLYSINRPLVRHPDGSFTTIGVVYDITKRKLMELELIAANARRAAIQEVALDCIIVMSHEGRILEFNPAAERTFGYSRDQVVGELLAEKLAPPHLRAGHTDGLKRFLRTGESRLFGRRIEITGMRRMASSFRSSWKSRRCSSAKTRCSPPTCATSPSARRSRSGCAPAKRCAVP